MSYASHSFREYPQFYNVSLKFIKPVTFEYKGTRYKIDLNDLNINKKTKVNKNKTKYYLELENEIKDIGETEEEIESVKKYKRTSINKFNKIGIAGKFSILTGVDKKSIIQKIHELDAKGFDYNTIVFKNEEDLNVFYDWITSLLVIRNLL